MDYDIPGFLPPKRPSRSLTSRIREFFEANPDEELLHRDVIAKFGCNRRTAENALAKLRVEGVIESVHVLRLKESRKP